MVKEWDKENMVLISAVAISVVGLIKAVVIGARKDIIRGSQATGKFAKAIYNFGKKCLC